MMNSFTHNLAVNEPEPNGEPLPSGARMVDGAKCVYGEAIKAGDLVKADFDSRRIETGGGLYLVQQTKAGAVVWYGCRRMMRVPEGIAMDNDGKGDWKTVWSLETYGIDVVATVQSVYRDVYRG